MTDLALTMDDPYESLPDNMSVGVHMMAGAAAGIGEHCVMYPIDCVKTRMQSIFPDPNANYRNIIDAFYKIVRQEGIGRTVKGISAVVGGAGPAHAMYFAVYEKLKEILSGGKQGNHLAHGAAGCVATVFHDIVMNPAEVIKQRMQLYNSIHATCTTCGRHIYQREGIRAFYRSYTTQLTMNVPFQAIHFMVYEFTQDIFNPDRTYNPKTHMMSGGIAGAFAASVTMPLDVCKTVLNTQEPCARLNLDYISGIRNAFLVIYQQKGIRGFFRGTQARVVFQMPATAISWSIYEFFKYVLFKQGMFGSSGAAVTSTYSTNDFTNSNKND